MIIEILPSSVSIVIQIFKISMYLYMAEYEIKCFEKNALKKGVFRTLVRFGFRVYASLKLGL